MSHPTTSTSRDLCTGPRSSHALGDDDARALVVAPVSDARSLCDVLAVVAEFGLASLGLVSWEMWSSDEALTPLWVQAVMELLLEPAGVDDTGETVYRLSKAGHARLALGD